MGLVFSIISAVSELFGKKSLSQKFTPVPGITLYDNERSPSARRVRMTLLEKGIEFTKVEVDLMKGEQLSDEYKHICPNKKVPAIAFVDVPGVEDSFLFESNVITEFLDADVFPGPKLYPVNAWERAQVKMWQDWELGLVDDFVPFVYTNTVPFALQLIFGTKERFLASLPADISPAKKEHWSKVFDASLSTASELKQHAISCYQNLPVLEKALEGRKFLVGDSFSSADLSILPRVAMYNSVGLTIPERHFPNIVAYLNRLGSRYSIQRSQNLMPMLLTKLIGTSWAIGLGNWRAGRNLERLDGSVYLEQALSQLPADMSNNPGWKSAVQGTECNAVLVADCACCPECWQIKLLLREKGVKYTMFTLPHQDVVGRWAGSGGLIRIHHNGHDVIGIRAVLDYLDSTFSQDAPRFLPKDPPERAKVQSWQAWDQTMGYLELAPLLEMRLVSHFVAQRYAEDLPGLYSLNKDPQYQTKFPSILQSFVCGVVSCEDSSSILEEVAKEHNEVITRATEALQHQKHWEDLLEERLKHLNTELKKEQDVCMVERKLTIADITVFCRLCFFSGLGVLRKKNYEGVTGWFEHLKESRPHFCMVNKAILDMFDKLNP